MAGTIYVISLHPDFHLKDTLATSQGATAPAPGTCEMPVSASGKRKKKSSPSGCSGPAKCELIKVGGVQSVRKGIAPEPSFQTCPCRPLASLPINHTTQGQACRELLGCQGIKKQKLGVQKKGCLMVKGAAILL